MKLKDDEKLLHECVSMQNKVFHEYLLARKRQIASGIVGIEKESLLRWEQGRGQEVDDLIVLIEKASEKIGKRK